MNDCRLQKYVQMHGGMMMAHVRPFVRGEVANVLRTCPLYSKNKSTSYKTRSTHQDIFRKNLRSGYNIIKKAYFIMAIRTNIGPTYENHLFFTTRPANSRSDSFCYQFVAAVWLDLLVPIQTTFVALSQP